MGIIGSIATTAVGIVNPAAGVALGLGRRLIDLAKTHWKAALAIGAALALAAAFLILRGEIRHRDTIIAGQAALIASVKAEVDRGVGKPTDASSAPAYIRGFVANLATVTAALDRQSAALKAAQQDADAHLAAAAAAAKPTVAQQQREAVRLKIVDPARSTGLTTDEWGKL